MVLLMTIGLVKIIYFILFVVVELAMVAVMAIVVTVFSCYKSFYDNILDLFVKLYFYVPSCKSAVITATFQATSSGSFIPSKPMMHFLPYFRFPLFSEYFTVWNRISNFPPK